MPPTRPGAADVPPLPPGFECPECSYQLGGASTRICPECGYAVKDQDAREHDARRLARTGLPSLLKKHLAIAAGVVLATSILTVVASPRGEELDAGLLSAAATAAALFGSLMLGGLASLAVHPRDRVAAVICWLRSYLWLHGPWLCAPALVLLLGLARTVDVIWGFTNSVDIGIITPIVGAVEVMCWWAWAAVSVVIWGTEWHKGISELGIRRRWRLSGLVIVAIITFLTSLALGVGGGVLGAMALGAIR